jgi:hypothetical protein
MLATTGSIYRRPAYRRGALAVSGSSSVGAGTTTKLATLIKGYVQPSNITAGTASTASTFWTNVGINGVAVNTDFSAGVWKNIVSITGSGEMASIIGPTIGTNAATLDVEVTIDNGTPQTITMTWPSATDLRTVVGGFDAGTSMVFYRPGDSSLVLDSTKRWPQNGNFNIINTPTLKAYGFPRLRFETALLVRLRSSVNVTGPANQERQSGAVYMLD